MIKTMNNVSKPKMMSVNVMFYSIHCPKLKPISFTTIEGLETRNYSF